MAEISDEDAVARVLHLLKNDKISFAHQVAIRSALDEARTRAFGHFIKQALDLATRDIPLPPRHHFVWAEDEPVTDSRLLHYIDYDRGYSREIDGDLEVEHDMTPDPE